MRKEIGSTLGIVAAAVTIAFAFHNAGVSLQSQTVAFWITVTVTALFALGLIVAEWWSYFARRPRRYQPNSNKIRQYMVQWLSSGGRALILSRDLTWVGDLEKDLLVRKARKGELELLIANDSNLVADLRAAGAVTHVYGALGYVPKSRFTIIDYGRNGARVAIGRVRSDRHEITEHCELEDVFVLIDDLKSALIAAASRNV